jgi:peptide deformylase
VDARTEREAQRRAALEHIRQWGDPVLKMSTGPVTEFDEALANQAARMADLMEGAIGSGLAAPQVGILQRMFVYRPELGAPITAVVNPVLEEASEETAPDLEGCLSLQGVAVVVERPVAVRLRAQAVDGSELVLEREGHEARILQHELDHLDGVLMLDRTVPEQKRAALRALRDGVAMEVPALPPREEEERVSRGG